MASVTLILCAVLVVVIVYWISEILTRKRQRLPVGVKGFAALKLIVNCIKNGFDMETSTLMRRLETDLISIDLFGMKTWIVFGSQAKLAEAYQKKGDLLLRRPQNPVKPETVGLLSGHGGAWREQRRFALTTLRDLGMGKTGAEQRILDEVRDILGLFADKAGQPFDLLTPIGTAVVNVISSVIFASKFEHGDPDLFVMLENFNNLASGSHVRPLVTLTMFESFFKFPGIEKKIIEQRMKTDMARKIMKKRIEGALFEGPSQKDDFVGAYVEEMKKKEADPETSFTESQLVDTVEDLFGAGSETTSTTLRWALLFMATYPDVQNRVYDELKEHIAGADRLPTYSDRERTPYTEAVILETQRYASMIPLIRRLNTVTIELFDYRFEPETNFVANLWHMNRDGAVWERPDQFHPGHFINDEGQLINREKFNPFSLGKRQCIGESLARMELYLFFSAFILHFRFQAPDGVQLPLSSDASVGMVRAPLPYKICAVKRDPQ